MTYTCYNEQQLPSDCELVCKSIDYDSQNNMGLVLVIFIYFSLIVFLVTIFCVNRNKIKLRTSHETACQTETIVYEHVVIIEPNEVLNMGINVD